VLCLPKLDVKVYLVIDSYLNQGRQVTFPFLPLLCLYLLFSVGSRRRANKTSGVTPRKPRIFQRQRARSPFRFSKARGYIQLKVTNHPNMETNLFTSLPLLQDKHRLWLRRNRGRSQSHQTVTSYHRKKHSRDTRSAQVAAMGMPVTSLSLLRDAIRV
jgi:hypothetical protein